MILGTKARYAVMAMVELARRGMGGPVNLAELAEAQEITVPYLEQIFNKLRRGGLVKSVRGPGGGYVLARQAAQIPVSDIVQAVDESLKMTRCSNHGETGCMASKARCLTHDLWDGLGRQIHDYLHAVSLADVAAGRVKDKALAIQVI
ncbi:MAG: Rrf2 family transcriptional regulator [Pseudomonadota bacterium]|nr:Rrf2 family transcriptional regulator [Pseudomonadota bacterium]